MSTTTAPLATDETSDGAWQIKVDGLGYPSIYGTNEDGGPGDLIAHCFADHEHLVRSSPSLLSSLEGLLAHYITVRLREGLELVTINSTPEVISARAVIARARGQ